jgi:hypothetical protein
MRYSRISITINRAESGQKLSCPQILAFVRRQWRKPEKFLLSVGYRFQTDSGKPLIHNWNVWIFWHQHTVCKHTVRGLTNHVRTKLTEDKLLVESITQFDWTSWPEVAAWRRPGYATINTARSNLYDTDVVRNEAFSKNTDWPPSPQTNDYCWTWKDSDDGLCCTELLGLFWTLFIVLYVEDKTMDKVQNKPNSSVQMIIVLESDTAMWMEL